VAGLAMMIVTGIPTGKAGGGHHVHLRALLPMLEVT